VAGGIGAGVAVGENEARRGEIEREPQHGRDQEHGGKAENSSGVWMNSAVIRIRTEKDDRDRQQEVEHIGRQRQDQDDQDREDAEGEREIAALQLFAEFAPGEGLWLGPGRV
jgi:hypothetical protein